MDKHHDELTDTGIIRFQAADAQRRTSFLKHFERTTRPISDVDSRITVDFCAADFCVEVIL